MENLLIQLISGVVGGNLGGMIAKNSSLGTIGNSVVGAAGGLGGGALLGPLLGASGAGGMADLIPQLIGGGGGGLILTIVAGMIKKMMAK